MKLCRRFPNFTASLSRCFWDEHPPPHFHARYGEHKAQITIHQPQIVERLLAAESFRICFGMGRVT
ncbi:MAG: DUF4160 domain-containing protein [Limisphaerales bacterium]